MSRKKPVINEEDLIEGLTFSESENAQIQDSAIQTSQNKYYHPHPKIGPKGGKLGRPLTDNPKISVSFTCTKDEKNLYRKAAEKDNRSFSKFVTTALDEYIKNHKVL